MSSINYVSVCDVSEVTFCSGRFPQTVGFTVVIRETEPKSFYPPTWMCQEVTKWIVNGL